MHRNIQRASRSARSGQETTCCAEPFVELLRRGLRKPSQNNVTSADTVAAMVFARKPFEVFPAEDMDFEKWAQYLRGISKSQGGAMPHEEKFAHSDGNFFFGVAMAYFPSLATLDGLLVPGFEEQFKLQTSQSEIVPNASANVGA